MRNKTIHLLLTALFLLVANFAHAYSFEAVNEDGVTIYYNITSSSSKTVEVTHKDYNCYSESVNIPEIVEYNGETYSVTSIGLAAFRDCLSLASVEIPNSVTSIASSAFYGCSSLASVEIPNSVTSIGFWAFYGCSSLVSVVIPNSVTSIEQSTFYGCSSLASVEIPNSVTSIKSSAFQYCM